MALKARYPFFFFLLLLLAACTEEQPIRSDGEWVEVDLEYARMFELAEKGEERLVRIFDKLGSSRTPIASYHFVPAIDTAPLLIGAQRYRIPLERIATTSTTHVPFFEKLEGLERLTGCAYLQHIMDPEVIARIDAGELVEISDGQKIDKELVLALDPEVVLAFPFGQAMEDISPDASIPVLSVTEYLEPHPLGRAEWLKFFSLLIDKEAEARQDFEGIRDRYESIRHENMVYSFLPGVFFGSYWQGQWHASGGGSYMANLIRDAGGNYLVRGIGLENVNLDLEELVVMSEQAHAFGKILYSEEEVSYEAIVGRDERVRELVNERDMVLFFGNTHTADLFGQALLEPDVLLLEMSRIIRDGESEGHRYFLVYE